MSTHRPSHLTSRWHGVGLTDQGLVRASNQDAFAVLNDHETWIVADGMGGRAGGDVASRITVDLLVTELPRSFDAPLDTDVSDIRQRSDVLHQATHKANQSVRDEVRRRPDLYGMGTTLVILSIVAAAPQPAAVVAHVGDSRAYCLRNGILTQITRDHSFVEEALQSGTLTPLEASNHPMRHVLTRAVGAESHVETDITVYPLLPDDLLLLCTDGLTKMIDDHDIRRILLQPATSLLDIARALIKEANGHGGADNITVVLARNELTTSRQER
jgi:serine/threonine protein phosphatase PrpC